MENKNSWEKKGWAWLCLFLPHNFKFVRGERVDGLFGEALYTEYECSRCGELDACATESLSFKEDIKP